MRKEGRRKTQEVLLVTDTVKIVRFLQVFVANAVRSIAVESSLASGTSLPFFGAGSFVAVEFSLASGASLPFDEFG